MICEAACEAEVNSTSPTKRCPDFFVGSGERSNFEEVFANQHTWDVIRTNIDDDNTRFKPGTLDELGLSYGCDEDVGLFNLGRML